jgi:hypothetical protein
MRGPVRELWYAETPEGFAQAEAFARREDVPGRAVYDAINTFRDDATRRCIETVEEIVALPVDDDLKDLNEDRETVIKAIMSLPYPPSELRDSGHGLHPFPILKERVPVTDIAEADRVRKIRTRLTELLCGDPAIDHDAALLRRPGTTNSKDPAQPVVCSVIAACGATYDPTDLEELINDYIPAPLFTRKPEKEAATLKRGNGDSQWQERVDVDAAFAAIKDGHGCNLVQPSILTSLMMRGMTPDEAIKYVVEQTMAIADRERLGWDREYEIQVVTRRCKSGLKFLQAKHDWSRTTPPWLPAEYIDAWAKKQAEGKRPFFTSNVHGWHVRGFTSHDADNGGAAANGTGEPKTNGGGPGEASSPAWPTPYSKRSPLLIPRRKWIMGQHYNRGKTSATVGPSGIGKSQHALVEGVGMTMGRNLLTEEILDDRYRVWIWNGEDDIDEAERRLCAICEVYAIDRNELGDWLFLDDADTCHLEFAYGQAGRVALHERAIQTVADRIRDLRIDVAIFDPLIAIHTLPENDNTSLSKMIRTLQTRIAKPQSCAVDVIHHPRKQGKDGDGSLSIDDVRGAGAIVTSARSVRLLQPMSANEAEKFGLTGEEKNNYFRVERGKATSAKRGPLYWAKLEERPIPNGEGGAYGDVVTVCRLWKPPDATAKMTDTMAAAIREEIGKGDWLRERQARSKWAGLLVGRRLGLDMETKAGRQQAADLLNWLIKRGVLTTEFRTDSARNAREYVIPGKFGEA